MSMESKWYNVESVPESHIFLMEDRAGNEAIPICHTIPIIDLANSKTLDKIMQASKEYGFFQVNQTRDIFFINLHPSICIKMLRYEVF